MSPVETLLGIAAYYALVMFLIGLRAAIQHLWR